MALILGISDKSVVLIWISLAMFSLNLPCSVGYVSWSWISFLSYTYHLWFHFVVGIVEVCVEPYNFAPKADIVTSSSNFKDSVHEIVYDSWTEFTSHEPDLWKSDNSYEIQNLRSDSNKSNLWLMNPIHRSLLDLWVRIKKVTHKSVII